MARKILLADDSVTAQNMGRKILADAGYEVITVNNGSAALKKIAEQKPDLIVLDVYMPGYSGLEVCQRLKEVAETSRIPILLTVGKLEPFKPEESKRVRADGYIVKPFEASELLSALSKLEDKIVPRAESSKPGRLARATAAIEEGRDKTMAAEEDSGWKNRIAFPSKKKQAAAESDADDPAIYNPVNKDLRTVVDHKRAEQPKAAETEERVDLGALAPDGLPKDVTPEEIAALAAAAAQVKIAEEKAAAESAPAVAPAIEAEAHKSEEPQPKIEEVPEAPATVAAAQQDEPEKTETKNSDLVVAATPAEVTAVIAGLEQSSDEPVTMAMSAAAGAHSGPVPSRWTAVAVALAPEDAARSLEQEMQQSYAAFAAPEAAPATFSSAIPEPPPAPAPTEEQSSPAEPAVANVSSESETEKPFIAASVSAETVSTPAEEESEVAASPVAEENTPPVVDSALPTAAAADAVAPEISPVGAESEDHVPAPEVAASSEESPATAASEAMIAEARADQESAESKDEAPVEAAVKDFAVVAAPAEIPTFAASTPSSDATAPAAADEAPAEAVEKKEPDIAATTAAAWASWRRVRESGPQASHENIKDEAAMAVAAGAESTPEGAADSSESDPAIANIVDSVLADLRPKIVEEISRKLGKKK